MKQLFLWKTDHSSLLKIKLSLRLINYQSMKM
jgi:hypothetical protein